MAPLPTVMAALAGDDIGAAAGDRVVTDKLTGRDAPGPVLLQAARARTAGVSHTGRRGSNKPTIRTSLILVCQSYTAIPGSESSRCRGDMAQARNRGRMKAMSKGALL